MSSGTRQSVAVQVTAVRAGRRLRKPDRLVAEEPLEIRVAGRGQEPQTVGVTMRTPGHDFELAAGFLLSEGVLAGQEAIETIAYCSDANVQRTDGRFNTVTVTATVPVDVDSHRRLFAMSSACGVCGTASFDKLESSLRPVGPAPVWPLSQLLELPDRLRANQRLFAETGGLHGAGLFDRSGHALAVREDVGRHNAVDKLVGWAALAKRLPLVDVALVTSGRLGFEIVQKAAAAGISHVVAVSAPSSLAVDLARRMGMTVVAFVRGDRANVYCGEDGVDMRAGGGAA